MSSIDVVIPCYRYGRYLRECVQSVLTQGITNVRILIIDDESPDETPEIASALTLEDSRVSYRRHQKNCGHISTFNEGIAWLSADYMLLLSADDYVLPGAFKRAMTLMDSYPDIGFTFGNAMALFEDGSTNPMLGDTSMRNVNSSTILQGQEFIDAIARHGANNIVPTPTAIVRTRLLKQLGGYDPALPHTSDLEMWLRLAAHSSVGYLQGPQAIYRRHSANMSLGYDFMRDLLQRKAALEVFLEGCGGMRPDAASMKKRLFVALAIGSLNQASTAYNNGDLALSTQIRDFAQSLHPEIIRTMDWNRLAIKRLLGRRLTSLAVPAIARWRRLATKVRGAGT